jgi:hypothetical protein
MGLAAGTDDPAAIIDIQPQTARVPSRGAPFKKVHEQRIA